MSLHTLLFTAVFLFFGTGWAAATEAIRPNTGPGADLPAQLRKEFFKAASEGDVSKAKELLGQQPLLLNARPDNDHRTPLIIASWNNQVDIVKFLIASGADLEAEDFVWGASALGWSGWFGRPAVALLLIEAGAEVNHPNRSGVTPLGSAIAAQKGKVAQGSNGATAEEREAIIKLFKEKEGVPKVKRSRPWPIIEGWADIE